MTLSTENFLEYANRNRNRSGARDRRTGRGGAACAGEHPRGRTCSAGRRAWLGQDDVDPHAGTGAGFEILAHPIHA